MKKYHSDKKKSLKKQSK